MEISPELIAALQAAQAATVSTDNVSVGFSRGLLESVLANLGSKPATLVRGDFHSSNCALITSGGKKSTIEAANGWLGQVAEMAQAEMAVLDVSVVMDARTIAKILKVMAKEAMTYAIVKLSKVPGIHKRLAKNAAGDKITALTVDLYDKETIEITAASNPMMLSAFYSENDDEWMEAVTASARVKRGGIDGWKATQAEAGAKTESATESSEDNLDLLEDEVEVTTTA